MPPGNSIDPKSACTVPSSPLSANLQPEASDLLSLGLALSLTGLAIGLATHFRLALISLFSAHLPLSNGWLPPMIYGTAGLLVFLLLRFLSGLIDVAFYSVSKRKQINPPPAPVEDFVGKADLLHIDPRIARETFHVLAGLMPEGTPIDLPDHLRGELQLSEAQIATLLDSLPEICDRSKLPVGSTPILNVYDLLAQIESAPVRDTGQNGALIPPQSQSPAFAHADLQHASPHDSRFRTRAHFSGVKRRASDYSGPYRRATDRNPDADYAGPLRRASDRPVSQQKDSERSVSDRRLGDRRSVSTPLQNASQQEITEEARQHKAVSSDTRLLELRLDLTGIPNIPSAGQALSASLTGETTTVAPSPPQRG